MRRVVAHSLFLFVAAFFASSVAHAQSGDPARARAEYERAVELERQGRHQEAAAAYRAAYQNAGGRELMYVIIGQSPDGSARPLLDTLSRLIDGTPAPAGLGAAPPTVPDAPAPVSVQVAAVPDATAVPDADAAPDVDSTEASASSDGGGLSPDGDGQDEVPHQNEVGVIAWSLAGLGAAALLGGGVTGILALETEDELNARCPGMVCPPEEESRLERGQLMAGLSTGLLIGGGAAVMAGVLIGLLWPTDEPAPDVAMACTDSGCMGQVGGRF